MVNQKYDVARTCEKCGAGLVFEARGDDGMGCEYCPDCGMEKEE